MDGKIVISATVTIVYGCINKTKVRARRVVIFHSVKSYDANCHSLKKEANSTKGISNFIFSARFVFDHKCELLEEFYPFSMSRVKSLLGTKKP